MSRFRLSMAPLALAALTTLAACGGGDSPSDPPPGGGGGDTISGNERLGWSQSASDASALAAYRYAVYVDGRRNEMSDVSCGAWSSSAPSSCSGRLPSMTAGSHTLELATFVMDNGNPVESTRSAPLQVTVRASTAAAQPEASRAPAETHSRALTTADGISLVLEAHVDGLDHPTDLAFAPDGRLFVAEQGGRIRIASNQQVDSRPAAELADVAVLGTAGGLLSLALDPQFARTGFVYALHTAAGREGELVFRLVRLREVAGTLGERAVLLDAVPASAERPAGAVRIGPDAKLYVALDDGGNPEDARRLSSPNGKILRLNLDGTTPADQPAGNPVHTAGIHSPRGVDWHPSGHALWTIEASSARASHAAQAFPRQTIAASGVFYRSDVVPAMTGDLFVADERGGLLRLRFERRPSARPRAMERLLSGDVEATRAVAEGPDGFIYLAAGSSIARLRPPSASAR